MTEGIQAILGELFHGSVVGATYTDMGTLLSVQKQIQKLATLHPDYANCPTNKRANAKIGPKFARALATFNKQFGTASDGATITDNTLAALRSDRVQSAMSGSGAPPISPDAQALVDLASAQAELEKAARAKVQAVTPRDKAKVQAAVAEADAKVQDAANKVQSTTDDPETKQAAETAKFASKDAVNAATLQQAADAAGKVADANQKVRDEVAANPAASAVHGGSILDVLKQQVGPLPLWGWTLAGAGAGTLVYLVLGRKIFAK